MLACAVIAVLLLGAVVLGGAFAYQKLQSSQFVKNDKIQTAREWGRLAPFPASATGLVAKTEGSMFTRSFRIKFTAPQADIDSWLQASPGTSESPPDVPSPGVRHFNIKPGGGAQHAEVVVDDITHTVGIYVYWSRGAILAGCCSSRTPYRR